MVFAGSCHMVEDLNGNLKEICNTKLNVWQILSIVFALFAAVCLIAYGVVEFRQRRKRSKDLESQYQFGNGTPLNINANGQSQPFTTEAPRTNSTAFYYNSPPMGKQNFDDANSFSSGSTLANNPPGQHVISSPLNVTAPASNGGTAAYDRNFVEVPIPPPATVHPIGKA